MIEHGLLIIFLVFSAICAIFAVGFIMGNDYAHRDRDRDMEDFDEVREWDERQRAWDFIFDAEQRGNDDLD